MSRDSHSNNFRIYYNDVILYQQKIVRSKDVMSSLYDMKNAQIVKRFDCYKVLTNK